MRAETGFWLAFQTAVCGNSDKGARDDGCTQWQPKYWQAIYETVVSHPVHPTAEYVYEHLKPRHPSLSLGTVYRNLGILAEQGLIRKIGAQGDADRFDGNMEPHSHVQCRECGRLEDVFLSYDAQMDEKAQEVTGFQIKEHSVIFSGICPSVCGKGKNRLTRRSGLVGQFGWAGMAN